MFRDNSSLIKLFENKISSVIVGRLKRQEVNMIEYIIAWFLLAFMWFVYRFKKLEYLVKDIPGPLTIPLLGNGLLFVNSTPEKTYLTTIRLLKEYGSILRVFLGTKLFVVLSNPKDVEILLSSQALIEKSDEYDFMRPWLGTGLLTSTGQKWFQRRKVLTPAFHFKILEQFIEVFDKNSEIFVENISNFGVAEFDIFPLITLCALDVICQTSMGVGVNAQKNADSKYVKAVQGVSGIISVRHFNFLYRNNIIFNLSPLYWKQKAYLKTLHGFTDSVIVSRREELTKSQNDGVESNTIEDAVGAKKKMALLDVLLQSTINGQPLSNLDIREEVDTFMFEGHDTTTSGIAFCLYNLAKYPNEQQKAFNEIRNVLGDDANKAVTLKDLNDLNFLELVIKESLRLYPSVPFFGRKIRKDFVLSTIF